MKNRLEYTIESLCHGLNKWDPKRSACKYLNKYSQVDCDYIQGNRFCYNTETNSSEIILYNKNAIR